MSFAAWMHQVDLLCFAWYGLSIRDLPDMNFRDAFDDGASPEEFMEGELGTLSDLSRLMFG
ncbi:MAG TPA: hypothetical protein PKA27_15650 [Fimbriimonadaceae bacterium]|nr:hypothetical protein [Fimbriimonadaceae bacterium]